MRRVGWREERDPTDSRCQGKVGADIMDRVTMEGILTAGREQGAAVNLSIIPFDKKILFRRRRIRSGFTYISTCVKYTMFFFNFLFWLSGLLLVGVGVYAALDKWSSGEAFKLQTIFDVMFNIGFLLMIIGGIIFIVSFAGCIGALRENMFLLKFYSLCLLIFFLAEMTLLALSFIYPNKLTEFLDDELSEKLIQSYRDDLDFQNLIDLVQVHLKIIIYHTISISFIFSTTLNVAELGQTVIKSGARMSTSTAQETLQITPAWRGKINSYLSSVVNYLLQMWGPILLLPCGH